MTKYSKDYIAKLLDRYMDGTSTLGEEDILADYFHRGNVPEEWADFQQLFQASVAVLLVTIMWQQTGQHHTEKTSAVLTAKADTVSCSQVEQKTDTATFQKVQPQPVKIKKRRLRKPKPTMTDIDKTYALMAEAEQEVIEAQLAAHGYIPIMQEDGTIIYIHEQTKLLSYEE